LAPKNSKGFDAAPLEGKTISCAGFKLWRFVDLASVLLNSATATAAYRMEDSTAIIEGDLAKRKEIPTDRDQGDFKGKRSTKG
jgi:hypothetical protein